MNPHPGGHARRLPPRLELLAYAGIGRWPPTTPGPRLARASGSPTSWQRSRAWWAQTGFNKMLARYGRGIELTPQDIAALAVRALAGRAAHGADCAGGRQTGHGAAATARPAGRQRLRRVPTSAASRRHTAAAAPAWSVDDPAGWTMIHSLRDSRIDIKRTVDAVKATSAQLADEANPVPDGRIYIGKVAAQLDRLADSRSNHCSRDLNSWLHAGW